MELKRNQLLTILLIMVGVSTVIIFSILNWMLLIRILDTTYLTKVGISWWRVWSLDNQLFTAAILLTICSMITLPTRSTLYTVYSKLASIIGLKPIGKRVTVFWRILEITLIFGMYILNAGYSLSGHNIAYLLFLSNSGAITINPQSFGLFLSFILNPYTSSTLVIDSIPLIEAFNFYSAMISTVFIFTVFRLGILAVSDLLPPKPLSIIMKGSIIGVLISISGIFSINTWRVNIGTWIALIQIGVQTALFATLFVFVFLYQQKFTGAKARRRELKRLNKELSDIEKEIKILHSNPDHIEGGISPELTSLYTARRELVTEIYHVKPQKGATVPIPIRSMGILAIPMIIVLIAAPLYQLVTYEIQMDGAHYIDWKFQTEVSKQIDITRWSAGIDQFQRLNLTDFLANTSSGNIDDLQHVRQWDEAASRTKMQNQIGVNWMRLADSDIIFVGDQEYWMAPLTLNPDQTESDWLSQTLRYTHAEGLIAINSFTGVVLSDSEFEDVFNVSSDTPIYYGDDFPDHEVYVNVLGYEEINGLNFPGTPDFTISGLDSALWMLGRAQFSFMGQTLGMLIDRDVRQRVDTILLPGLKTESDIYPVFSPEGLLYFAVPIYIDYELSTEYTSSNYNRFLGVALVDAIDGSITFYESDSIDEELPDFLRIAYLDFYDWSTAPNWLQKQLKYPEDLWETQLSTDYVYHVQDAQIWRSGEDDFRLPDEQDVHFVTLNINGQIQYVGVQLVEFAYGQGANLAGIYLVGSGDYEFGLTTFYRAGGAGSDALFGPVSALEAFKTDSDVKSQLTLLGTYGTGNILLYQINGTLLYVIPIYIEVGGGSGATITKLGGVGLVDALTGEQAALGSDVIEAYEILYGNITGTIDSSSNLTLVNPTFTDSSITPTTNTTLPLVLRNNDNIFHNASIRIVTYSPNIDLFRYGTQLIPIVNPQNQTFDINPILLGPNDFFGTDLVVSASLDQGAVLEQYRITLQVLSNGTIVESNDIFLTVRED